MHKSGIVGLSVGLGLVAAVVAEATIASHNNRVVQDLAARICASVSPGAPESSLDGLAARFGATLTRRRMGVELTVSRPLAYDVACRVEISRGRVGQAYVIDLDD